MRAYCTVVRKMIYKFNYLETGNCGRALGYKSTRYKATRKVAHVQDTTDKRKKNSRE
jgi:hypothetical protein